MVKPPFSSHRQIIAGFRSCESLARCVRATGDAVRNWKRRNSIPPRYWLPLVEAAQARGIALSVDDLAEIARRR